MLSNLKDDMSYSDASVFEFRPWKAPCPFAIRTPAMYTRESSPNDVLYAVESIWTLVIWYTYLFIYFIYKYITYNLYMYVK